MELDPKTHEAVAAAGQLLLRAAATLGTLTPEQQARLAQVSGLPALLSASLQSAAHLSPDVRRAAKASPPRGFKPPA